MTSQFSRRQAILAAGGVAAAAVFGSRASAAEIPTAVDPVVTNGRIKQSVSKWCFGSYPLDGFAAYCKKLGMKGVDLLGPGDFATLKKHDLVCTMVSCNSIPKGFNRPQNHDELIANLKKAIDATSEAGFPNVIAFSGNRAGMDDEEGAKNCIEGLKKIADYAEEKKVTVCMELLNSKRDHKDYMCDHTAWGAKVCRGVGSPRIKLLYDIYHMQIMEGDCIATLRQFKDCIGHIHTGGVPGRNEIDDTQEIYYPAIMKALVNLKYDGYVAHEFVPRAKDPLASLASAVKLCDV